MLLPNICVVLADGSERRRRAYHAVRSVFPARPRTHGAWGRARAGDEARANGTASDAAAELVRDGRIRLIWQERVLRPHWDSRTRQGPGHDRRGPDRSQHLVDLGDDEVLEHGYPA